MKTVKYKMSIFIGDMLSTSLYISAKEYKRIEKELTEQHNLHCDINEEFYTEYEENTFEKETYIITEKVFSYSEHDIRLVEFKCKDGFYFKK
jgi:hypothetical protein